MILNAPLSYKINTILQIGNKCKDVISINKSGYKVHYNIMIKYLIEKIIPRRAQEKRIRFSFLTKPLLQK